MPPHGYPVVIIGAHAIARFGIRQLVTSAPQVEVVDEYSTTDDLKKSGHIGVSANPLIVVLDYHSSPANLEGPLGEISEKNVEIRFILISRSLNESVLRKLSATGVRAFVLDNDRPPVIRQALATVLTGGMWISPSVLASIASSSGERFQLTTRERQVLDLVRRGATNATIAKTLSITSSTVEFHMKNIFDKLGAHSRTDALFRAEKEDV